MYSTSFIRRFLVRGAGTLAITLLLLSVSGCHGDKSTDSEVIQPTTTMEVSTTCTTLTSTTTLTTTTTTTLATTTTVAETTVTSAAAIVTTQPPTESRTIAVATDNGLPITEQEFTLIANVISHEAGSSWIGEYERACIVAAIMNRVADERFPNSIDGVVHQAGQMFDVPYYRVDYSGIGNEPIDSAIYAYFNGAYDCGSINSWSGNGRNNNFYYQ